MFKLFQKKSNNSISDKQNSNVSIPISNRYALFENNNVTEKPLVKKSKSNILARYQTQDNDNSNVLNIDSMYFPALVKQSNVTVTDEIMNFAKINYKQETETSEENYTLFNNDCLTLDFENLINVVDDFALYRIYLSFLETKRKIILLNIIHSKDFNKGNHFYTYFNIEHLIQHEMEIRICLETINTLYYCIGVCDELNATLANNQNEDSVYDDIYSAIEQLQIQNKKLNESFKVDLTKISHILSCDELIKKTEIVDELKLNLNRLVKLLISKNDVMIDCNYHVALDKINETEYIHPVGISSFTYLNCDDCYDENGFIDLFVSVDKLKLSEEDTSSMFIDDMTYDIFKNLNSNTTKINTQFFFKIYKKKNQFNLNVFYDIYEELPCDKCQLIISNIPKDHFLFYSLIQKSYSDPDRGNISSNSISNINKNMINRWLKKTLHDSTISEIQYNNVDDILKDAYDYTNVDSNGFHVDYVFNELLKLDPTSSVISTTMVNEFRKLAFFKST